MEWISVEDRLPEAGIPVFCYCFEDFEQRAWYVDSKDWGDEGWSHHFKNDYDKYISVTHWMPLPKPPND